jgi:hypothetical protein
MMKTVCPLLSVAAAHEYLADPPARTGDNKLNAVAMGSKLCRYSSLAPNEDLQCGDETDPAAFARLFHVQSSWADFACGGSTLVQGKTGSQGLMQAAGDMISNPEKFKVSLQGPEKVTTYAAGSEVEMRLHGFFHEGVMRIALCFPDKMDCQKMSSYNKYVLGYHFTEGTAGLDDIYNVDLPFKVKLPQRNGKAIVQWLVDAEDVRSYVSCSDIELVGATQDATSDQYMCNGHPLCNCTLSDAKVGLHGSCPRGTAPHIHSDQSSTGTDIVKQYKDQLGAEEFCKLCITNGCPSTCGGIYKGFYEGDKCTNTPVREGCGDMHSSALPKFLECSPDTCKSSNWLSSDIVLV